MMAMPLPTLLTVLTIGMAPQDTLTLQQAIEMAQQRGHQARAARATRDASRYREHAFNARQLPQLSVGGTLPDYNRSIIPVVQPDGSTQFRPQQQTNANLRMSLSQTLPVTGGSVFVSSSLARLRLTGTQSVETWSSTPLTIGLRQELLRPNNLRWDRREQAVRGDRDERAYLEALEDIAIQTTDLFFNAYAARVALANAITNAAVNDTLYRLNTGRFEVGRIGENDLLQSELALLRSRSALDAARLEYDRATAALRIQLALPAGARLEAVVQRTVPDYAADTTLAISEARRNRSVVADVQLQDVQARRRIRDARSQGGPGATVTASYGYNNSAPAMSEAYENLLEARQFSMAVSVPLWQWGAGRANVRAAEADRERINSLAEQSLEQLAHDARFAALELAQARSNVLLLERADSVAGRRFGVAYNRYGIGRITVDALYIAQNEKDAAVTQFVAGLRRYWQAHYRLRRTTLYDFEQNRAVR